MTAGRPRRPRRANKVTHYTISAGDCSIGLRRHAVKDDVMVPVLTFRDVLGTHYQIDLTAFDVKTIAADCEALMAADQQQVSRWWAALADGSDGRPAAITVARSVLGNSSC